MAPLRSRNLALLAVLVAAVEAAIGACGVDGALAGCVEEEPTSFLSTPPRPSYDPAAGRGQWFSAPPVPQGVEDVVAARVGSKVVLAVGRELVEGSDTTVEARTTRIFCLRTHTWRLGRDAPKANSAGAAVSFRGIFYYVGGRGVPDALWAYSPAADRWTVLPAMPTARRNLGAAVLGNAMYAIGGRLPPAPEASPVVERYDLVHGEWSQVKSLPRARNGLRAAALGGRIYAIGGLGIDEQAVGTVDIYHPEANEWTTSEEVMPTPRGFFQLFSIGSLLFVAGGWDGVTPADDSPINLTVAAAVEAYDAARDVWKAGFKPMPTPRAFGGGACGQAEGFVIGGASLFDFSMPLSANEVFRLSALPHRRGPKRARGHW